MKRAVHAMGGPYYCAARTFRYPCKLVMLQCSNKPNRRMLLQSTLWKGRLVFNFARSTDTFDILKKLRGTNPFKDAQARGSASAGRAGTNSLRETRDFGADPGQLRIATYLSRCRNRPRSSWYCMAVGRPRPPTITEQDSRPRLSKCPKKQFQVSEWQTFQGCHWMYPLWPRKRQ